MEFFLSKVLLFLIQPLSWIIILLLISWIWKKSRVGKWSFRLGLLGLIAFSNPLLINQVTRAWETDPVLIEDLEESHDIGIVLGGFTRVVEELPDRLHFNCHPNRLIHAIQLYHAGKIQKILVVGGSAAVVGSKRTDTPEIKAFLVSTGIDESDVLIEVDSRNTWENAKFCTEMVNKEFPDATCMLFTSAMHMPRATACFAKAGLKVTPFPTDQMEHELHNLTPDVLIVPKSSAFSHWNALIKEWVGMVVYKMRGYA